MKRFLKVIWLILSYLLWKILFWIIPTSRHKDKLSLKERIDKSRKIFLRINKALNLEYFVSGLENIDPNNTYFFACNHQSSFDPLAVLSTYPGNMTFVAKKEINKLPVVPRMLNIIDGLAMDREDLKQSLRVMMNVEKDLADQKVSWLIFPEGTRNRDIAGLLLPFHPGTFRPAYKSHTTIVPIAIFGTFRTLKFKLHLKKFPIFVHYLKPITYEEYKDMTTEEIASLVSSRIQKEISFSLRKEDLKYITK